MHTLALVLTLLGLAALGYLLYVNRQLVQTKLAGGSVIMNQAQTMSLSFGDSGKATSAATWVAGKGGDLVKLVPTPAPADAATYVPPITGPLFLVKRASDGAQLQEENLMLTWVAASEKLVYPVILEQRDTGYAVRVLQERTAGLAQSASTAVTQTPFMYPPPDVQWVVAPGPLTAPQVKLPSAS